MMIKDNNGIVIEVDASLPASGVADTLLEGCRRAYRSSIDIDKIQGLMNEIWVHLHHELTEDETSRIGEVVHVSLPMNDLNASISRPPSRKGYFVIFDAMLDVRVTEIFTAPRTITAWAASYVRAAWGETFNTAYWVGPAVDKLKSISSGLYPDSFSIGAARDFIFAHECGHYFLGHLNREFERQRSFGDQNLSIFDPIMREELDADRFACNLLCRSEGRPLLLQQMGVDWLFGFLSGVMAMRKYSIALLRGDAVRPPWNGAIERRRAETWQDYHRRCLESTNKNDSSSENLEAVRQLRESVDNFNSVFPLALAYTYVAAPAELIAWADEVLKPMTEEDFKDHHDALRDLSGKADSLPLPQARWKQRIHNWINKVF